MANLIKIGLVSILVGPFSILGEEAVRGAKLAISEFGGKAAGKKIDLYIETSNAIPDSAVQAAEELFDRHGVDFVVGPLSGNEGLAMRTFAKKHPDKAFINGSAAGQDATLRDPAPNFFSFSTNGVQWVAGLGSYAYHGRGYRQVATLAEDYSYPHGQVGGFMIEFCRAGGRVVKKFWSSVGNSDYSAVIAGMPDDIDALFVALSGQDAIHFLEQYTAAGKQLPLIAGTNVVEQTVLKLRGALAEKLAGTLTAGPTFDNNPEPAWQEMVAHYRRLFPDANATPSHTAYAYYLNMKAALLGLERVEGDIARSQAGFMKALATLEFATPTGMTRLDHNRAAIGNNFLTEVAQAADGSLYTKLIKLIPAVNQSLGIPDDEYFRIGSFNRDNPNCP